MKRLFNVLMIAAAIAVAMPASAQEASDGKKPKKAKTEKVEKKNKKDKKDHECMKGEECKKDHECKKDGECKKDHECMKGHESMKDHECMKGKECKKDHECIKDKECMKDHECIKDKECMKDHECMKGKECKKDHECIKDKECKKDHECMKGKECNMSNVDDMTIPFVLDKPILKTDGDSIAYMFGVSNANGLKNYATTQLGLDPEYFDYFYNGMMARATMDTNDKARIAYMKGLAVGDQVEQMANGMSKQYYGDDDSRLLSKSVITAGIIEGMTGVSSISIEDANTKVRDVMTEKQKINTQKQKDKAIAEGEAFLTENAKKPGVVTLPSGLQYKVIEAGNGEKPKETDKVKVNYEGHLIDGTEFDSSYKRKEPASFNCNQVIKGWTEALCLMPVGSKWELYIPYQLAYGERAAGKIPPCSTLIFSVELLSIEK